MGGGPSKPFGASADSEDEDKDTDEGSGKEDDDKDREKDEVDTRFHKQDRKSSGLTFIFYVAEAKLLQPIPEKRAKIPSFKSAASFSNLRERTGQNGVSGHSNSTYHVRRLKKGPRVTANPKHDSSCERN